MTAAEKLVTVAENMPKVYDAGKNWVFQYMTQPHGIFYKAAFPAGSCLRISLPNCTGLVAEMFRLTTGLDTLELLLPDVLSKANYMFYSCSLRVLRLPGGLRVSEFISFANRCEQLEEIDGVLDLTESSSNDGCFGSCNLLREVRFAPNSIRKSISFKQSGQLSEVSVASILAGLATVATPQTLTLHDTVKATLTNAQIAALEAKNWLLA